MFEIVISHGISSIHKSEQKDGQQFFHDLLMASGINIVSEISLFMIRIVETTMILLGSRKTNETTGPPRGMKVLQIIRF